MNDPLAGAPKTNVDLLKLLVVSVDGFAEKLIAAATSQSDTEQALTATKAVLLSQVEATLATLKNAKN